MVIFVRLLVSTEENFENNPSSSAFETLLYSVR